MALPVLPPPRPPPDIATTGWAHITVRIAWTLLALGVRVHGQVLKDARDHVLYHLDRTTPLSNAEDRADSLTRAFVRRARGKHAIDPWAVDAEMPLSPRWKRALGQSLTPLAEAVFKHHYADNRSLEWMARTFRVDRLTLQAARGGLREVVRRAATDDGVPIDQWPNERLDRLLTRLAAWSESDCPPALDVAGGAHQDHARSCTRCDRLVRLCNAGVVGFDALTPPSFGARPKKKARVLALHFHPHGRADRAALMRELAAVAHYPLGDDLLLVDFRDATEVTPALVLAAEVGMPVRDHLRGAVLEGMGGWTPHGLVGPLAARAETEVRSRPWGTIDEIGELPARMPAPPSSWKWWTGNTVLASALAVVLLAAWPEARSEAGHPLEVAFTSARSGVWTAFDVDEDALVTLVREVDGQLDVVLASKSAADKAAVAAGDGSYRLHTEGRAVLLVSSSEPVDEAVLAAAVNDGQTIEKLATRLREAHPDADARLFRP